MMIAEIPYLFDLLESTCPEWSQARAAWCQVWIGVLSVTIAVVLLVLHLLNRRVKWIPKSYLVNNKITKVLIINESGINATDYITLGQPCYIECSLSLLDKIRNANRRGNKYIIKKLIPYIHNNSFYDHIATPSIDINDVNNLTNIPSMNFVNKIVNTSFKIYGNNNDESNSIILKNSILLSVFKREHRLFQRKIYINLIMFQSIDDTDKDGNIKMTSGYTSFDKWYLQRLNEAQKKEIVKNKLLKKEKSSKKYFAKIDLLSSQITRLRSLQKVIIIPFFDKKHKEKIAIIRG